MLITLVPTCSRTCSKQGQGCCPKLLFWSKRDEPHSIVWRWRWRRYFQATSQGKVLEWWLFRQWSHSYIRWVMATTTTTRSLSLKGRAQLPQVLPTLFVSFRARTNAHMIPHCSQKSIFTIFFCSYRQYILWFAPNLCFNVCSWKPTLPCLHKFLPNPRFCQGSEDYYAYLRLLMFLTHTITNSM